MSDRQLEIGLGDLIILHDARVERSDDGVALVVDVVVGQAELVDGRHRGGQSRLGPLGPALQLAI